MLLMIVHKINVTRVAVFKTEDHTVIGPDSHGMESLHAALERVKAEAGEIHVLRRSGTAEDGENVFDLLNVIGADPLTVAVLEKAFQALVPETLYHEIKNTVTSITCQL